MIVKVDAVRGGQSLDIVISSDAPVSSAADGHHAVPIDDAGHAELSVPIAVGTGKHVGYVRAMVTQGAATGTTVTEGADTLWLARAADGTLLSSRQSSVVVERTRARHDAHGDPAAEKANLAALDLAPRDEIRTSARPNATTADQVLISGTATYEDRDGTTHPARDIKVEFFPPNSLTGILTVTDDNGHYALPPIDPLPGENTVTGDLDFFAENTAAYIHQDSLDNSPYKLTTPVDAVPLGEARTIDVVARNTDGPRSLAFAMVDTFLTAYRYAVQLDMNPDPQMVVYFPIGTQGSKFVDDSVLGDEIDVGDFDWSDWDVLTHEYGHYVQHLAGISADVGGDHCVNANLSEQACGGTPPEAGYGKDKGTKLAWAESWPTFFGMSSQIEIPSPPIPDAEDEVYQDTNIDSNNQIQGDKYYISVPIDPQDPVDLNLDNYHGEDNEMAIIRFLWDLYDAGPTDKDGDLVYIPDTQIWNLINAAKPVTLSGAYQALSAGASPSQNQGMSCSLSQQRIAPYWGPDDDPNNAPAASIPVGSPQMLSWSAGNGDQAFHNNQFRVEAFDPTTGQAYATSPTLSTTTWTPTLSDWESMVRGHSDQIHVRVVGWQTDDPQTGPYVGCARTLQIDSALVNDSGCTAAALPIGDSGWEFGHIDPSHVDLPFPVNYFGTTYTSLSVNTDGFVTFGGYWWTPPNEPLWDMSYPVISPFRGWVDTSINGSSPVTYSTSAITFDGRPAFCINWINVGYRHPLLDPAPLDSFQLILVDRSDRGPGDFDIVFNYGSIQWDTADPYETTDGRGVPQGVTAVVGYSDGDGSYMQLAGSLQPGELLDGGIHALNTNSYNSTVPGRYVYPVHNGQPPLGPGTQISYVDSVAATTTFTNITVTLPTTIAANDLMLMFFSTPSTEAVTVPSGWTLAARTDTSFTGFASYVYYKVASSTDHGHNVKVTFATTNRKAVIQILAYRGVDTANPIFFALNDFETVPDPENLMMSPLYSLDTPPRAWLVTNFTSKSSAVTGWTILGGSFRYWPDTSPVEIRRSVINGSGSGYFNAVTTDRGLPMPDGPPSNNDMGQYLAATDQPFGSAVSWSVLLNAAP